MRQFQIIFIALWVIFCIFSLHFGVHHVEEGSVGVYWRGGALLDTQAKPGIHFMNPFLTTFKVFQVSFKTSTIENIPCGTSSGVMLYFSKIEVVHQLELSEVIGTVRNYSTEYEKIWIHDRVHHEINQICSVSTLHEVYISKFDQFDEEVVRRMNKVLSVWAPGVKIISMRLTKPRIPEVLRRSYEKVDTYKTQLLVATQKEKTILREAETLKRSAILEAEKQLSISSINSKKLEERILSKLEISAIEDKMKLNRAKQNADAWFYRVKKEATSMKQKLTVEYLNYIRAKVSFQNTEVYYGNAIPSALVSADASGIPITASATMAKAKDISEL